MVVYNESLSLAGCRVSLDSHDQKYEFEDINDYKAENAEAMHSMNGLPNGIVGVSLIPDWNFHKKK